MTHGDERAKEIHAIHRTENGSPTTPGTAEADRAWNALSDQARRTYRRFARQRG